MACLALLFIPKFAVTDTKNRYEVQGDSCSEALNAASDILGDIIRTTQVALMVPGILVELEL
jgi:hypothetical protein